MFLGAWRRIGLTSAVCLLALLAGCASSAWTFHRSLEIGAKPWGHSTVSSPNYPDRFGDTSERFEVRPGDCSRGHDGWDDCSTNRERSELAQTGGQNDGSEYWYGWSIFFPDEFENMYPTQVTLGQFHQIGGKPVFMFKNGEPPSYYSYHVEPGGYWLQDRTYPASPRSYNLIDEKDLRGVWHDILVHARWSRKDDGFFRVWVNGTQRVDRDGKTMTKSKVYFKYGIYRRGLRPKTVTQVVYYDEILRGKSRELVDIRLIERQQNNQ